MPLAITIIITIFAFLFSLQPVSAGISSKDFEDLSTVTAPNFPNPQTLIKDVLGGNLGILNLAIIFAGLALLLIILAGGFSMLTNPTNPEAQAKGRARITWGLVGFFIIFGTYWIAQILQVMFNLRFI